MEKQVQAGTSKRLSGLMESHDQFVHTIQWQENWALLLEADRQFFRDAVFLDERLLLEEPKGGKVRLESLFTALEKEWDGKFLPCHFIFHIGHAGSTLISRILDAVPGALNMREPLMLRPLAAARNLIAAGFLGQPEEKLKKDIARIYALLMRRFAPEDTVVIKTTSICTAIAPDLVALNKANRALVLSVSCEVNLANQMEKTQLQDLKHFTPHRVIALQRRAPDLSLDTKSLSRAQVIALNWLGEVVELNDLMTGPLKDRILAVNFDDFLKDRAGYMEKILKQFSLPADKKTAQALAVSDVFGTYAKKPDFKFTDGDRASLITEMRITHHRAIKEGLAFVEDLVKKYPAFGPAVKRFRLE